MQAQICVVLESKFTDKHVPVFYLERQMVLPVNNVEPSVKSDETLSAINSLRNWFAGGLAEELQPSSPNAVYTSSLTMWMLVLQRLTGGKSMEAIVKETIANVPSFVPKNKRVQNGQLSANSSSFSTARGRLKLKTVRCMFNQISSSIISQSSVGEGRRQWYLIDGTTMTLSPTEELKRCFPPATNQHGEIVWPVMMMFVAHEMESGCATQPVVSPMYGSKNASELKMSRKILKKLPPGSVVMADAGLGIFSVAYGAIEAKHDFLFRLTKARFDSLIKKAKLVADEPNAKTWELTWEPTHKERKTTPSLPSNARLRVRIHQYVPEQGKPVYLVTSLFELCCEQAAEKYGFRYDVETDIENIKVAMDTEKIRAASRAMVMKELYASLTAYNLVIQFRRQASEIARVPARRLSFQGVWDTFSSFLLRDLAVLEPEECFERYQWALEIAAKDKIRDRPGRSYRRAAHTRRPKTTKWQKQQRQEAKKQRQQIQKQTELETTSENTS